MEELVGDKRKRGSEGRGRHDGRAFALLNRGRPIISSGAATDHQAKRKGEVEEAAPTHKFKGRKKRKKKKKKEERSGGKGEKEERTQNKKEKERETEGVEEEEWGGFSWGSVVLPPTARECREDAASLRRSAVALMSPRCFCYIDHPATVREQPRRSCYSRMTTKLPIIDPHREEPLRHLASCHHLPSERPCSAVHRASLLPSVQPVIPTTALHHPAGLALFRS